MTLLRPLLFSTDRTVLSLSLKRRKEARVSLVSEVALIAQHVGSFVWHWSLIETVSSYCWRGGEMESGGEEEKRRGESKNPHNLP